jgi:hypothetical protein
MSLRSRRLLKERTIAERSVANGVMLDAVWAENLEQVQASEMLRN